MEDFWWEVGSMGARHGGSYPKVGTASGGVHLSIQTRSHLWHLDVLFRNTHGVDVPIPFYDYTRRVWVTCSHDGLRS